MTDQIDLHAASIQRSPADIADWPITVGITRLVMDPQGGLTFEFDQVLPDRWKWPSNPNDPRDNFQYTVWAVAEVGGQWQWYAAGFVQMWQGRVMGGPDHALPPILRDYRDWWGDVRKLWGPMSDYVPQAGDRVGFFVSAGNGRLTDGVTSVRERSNVVAIALPFNDAGVFTFEATAPAEPPATPPTPDPIVVPPGTNATTLQQRLDMIEGELATANRNIDVLLTKVSAMATDTRELNARAKALTTALNKAVKLLTVKK